MASRLGLSIVGWELRQRGRHVRLGDKVRWRGGRAYGPFLPPREEDAPPLAAPLLPPRPYPLALRVIGEWTRRRRRRTLSAIV